MTREQDNETWPGKPMDVPDSQITEIKNTDIVIVGAGLAGLSAARAASEKGARVIVVEKAVTFQCRSGQYGTMGNKIQREMGITFDKNKAILENMKQMGYRADQRAWNYWADHSGEDFDWLLEMAPDLHVMAENETELKKDQINLMVMHYPLTPEYDPDEEYSPTFPTVMAFLPSHRPILDRVYKKCLEQGCEFLFSTKVQQLIRPGNKGRVEGVIAQNIHGCFIRINAEKAVILAAGDYGGNKEMVAHYVPWAVDYVNYFPNKDAKGLPTNTGDGQRLGMWIGAKMEDGPHAVNDHTLGGPLGNNAYFLANARGQRFVNENAMGQQLSNALYRQPGNFAWQIFDDKWPEQCEHMAVSHGSVNHFVPDDEYPQLPAGCKNSIGKPSYISRKKLLETPGLIVAESLPELAEKIAPDQPKVQAALLQNIERYNELCRKGSDDDFGKTAKRMFPIETAPFYAGKMTGGAMLLVHGGLTVDPLTANVLDRDYNEIPGLYAAGNNQGGRFVMDYPVVTAGVSHSFALTYGRLAGSMAAERGN